MARNQTLGQLIDDVRSEAGHSLQANLGVQTRDTIVRLLQREQRRLWEDFAWTHLMVERDIQMQAGSRYYDFPADLDQDRISKVEFNYNDQWHELTHGIGDAQYNTYNSDRDVRSWPVERWSIQENNQFEVWPIPSIDGTVSPPFGSVRIHGIKSLRPLVAETDRADLDDTLLTLFVAAKLLARQKSADAGLTLAAAQRHYAKLKGRSTKTKSFSMTGDSEPAFKPRGPITVQRITTP